MTGHRTRTMEGLQPDPDGVEGALEPPPTREGSGLETGILTRKATTTEAPVVVDAVLDGELTPRPGDVLAGRYVLETLLGQGGMGWVYRAKDVALGRTVATKILYPSLAKNEEVFGRFTREARSMAALDHPNVVPVFDVGEQGPWHFFVMKLLSGETLHRRLDGPPLTEAEAVPVAIEILRGLEHMHGRGVTHRDIKPSNIVLTTDGRAIILDFGILRLESETRVTRAGLFMGTPEYVAPELIRSSPGDGRTDLYSLGVTLFEMVTGHVPFGGASPLEIVSQHLRDLPCRPSALQPGVSRALDAIVLHALAKEPDDRFQSAAEMREALEAIAEHPTAPRRAPTPIPTPVEPMPRPGIGRGTLALTLAVLVLIAAGAGLWAGTRTRPRRGHGDGPAAEGPVASVKARPVRPPSPDPEPPPLPAPTPEPTPATPFAAEPVAAPPVARSRVPQRPSARSRVPEKSVVERPATAPPGPVLASATGSALDRARAALREGDGSAAVRLFLEASRQTPGSAAPFRGLGDAYLAIGNRTAAIGAYRRYLVLNPNARDAEAVREKLRRLGAG